jgi:WXG100 family type VII secretion target
MTERIEANYEQLEQISTRFSQQADEVERLMQNVRGCVENLEGGGWIGRGADAFFQEMNDEVLPAVNRLFQAMQQGSQAAQQISNVVSTAEEEASSRFRAAA